MKHRKTDWSRLALTIGIYVFAIFYLYPIFLMIMNSFKTYGEIMTDVASFPQGIAFENFTTAWNMLRYPRAFLNTVTVCTVGVLGILFFASMAAYKLARTKTRYSSIILTLCVAPMLIPFQTVMITFFQVARSLGLQGSVVGLGIIYWGLGTPFTMFLYHGFVKTIPVELDECARIDGCSVFRLFFTIIFPLLKPVTATAAAINVMGIWNDFLMPLIMVNRSSSTRTLQLASFIFFGEFIKDWHLALAGLVLTITPAILFFLVMQKYIVKGVALGAVKG